MEFVVRAHLEKPAVLDAVIVATGVRQTHHGRAKLVDHVVDVRRRYDLLPRATDPYTSTIASIIRALFEPKLRGGYTAQTYNDRRQLEQTHPRLWRPSAHRSWAAISLARRSNP